MQCPNCGATNNKGSSTCSQCGASLIQGTGKIPNLSDKTEKLVNIPSEEGDQVVSPVDRPWEVRVPKRNASTAEAAAKQAAGHRKSNATSKLSTAKGAAAGAAAGATASSQKQDPTPRRVESNNDIDMKIGEKNTSRKAIFITAILIICAIAIGLIFFFTSNKPTYTVTFETNGGSSIAQEQILKDGSLNNPGTPTREGHIFEGWFLDADLSDAASFPIKVVKNMTLYAKWDAASPSNPASSVSSSSSTTASDGTSSNTGNNASGSGSGSGGTAGGGYANTGNGSGGGSGSGAGNSSGSGSDSGNGSDSGSGSSSNGNSENTVTVYTQSGQRLSGEVHLKDGYVIPNSSEHAYTIDELKALNLNDAELCIARNEPYARLGYSFKNPGLQAYFNARSWYHNSGTRPELTPGTAAYITAHNLLTLAEETPSARPWLRLRTY